MARMNHPAPPRSAAARRALAIQQMRERLARDSFPRLQMALIVALTGGFGLLASFVLLQLGLDAMALRYPLALGCAYAFFLGLLWLWLRTNAADHADLGHLLDLPDLPGSLARRSDTAPAVQSGGGGDFGGGGASASFDDPGAAGTTVDAMDTAPTDALGDAVSAAADSEGFAIPLVAIAMAIGLVLAMLYVVYIAPVLFAELLVDGALSYALFRHLRGRDPAHWLSSTVRRTALPFAATAVFLALAGGAMALYAPGAHSLGQAIAHSTRR
jgi:hypothetical protein